ncbi:hypothetical protein [Actinomadura sp. DC4]|uniref:hypothetical protein n=1 Tax=Actinomadura sp. DC4 TaxID=3055069 RepID=UPI0025B11154|nr:hypothetical protein [Actinomadura sp. DC4]MDN3357410.1 hypothetical protein [Actinomadura sp. DC4]
MDRYRLPASYGLISELLIQQSVQAMQAAQADAEWQAEIERVLRFWAWKAFRALVYLIGGVVALLYFNDGFTWTTAMTVGAWATGFVSLLWIIWVGRVHPDYEEGLIVLMWLIASGAHGAVLVWGWLTYGAASAVPWLFIELGVVGLVSGLMQYRKNILF